MKKPKLSARKLVYQDKYQRIYTQTADFGSFRKEYFVRDTGLGAGIVVSKGDSVLLVQQYRLQINGLSWEIPGGQVEDGERPEDAAVRECFEETGVQCHNIEALLFYLPGMDILQNPTHLFHSDNWTYTGGLHSPGDEIHDQAWVPLSTCMDMLAGGQIVDSKSMLALMAFSRLADTAQISGKIP